MIVQGPLPSKIAFERPHRGVPGPRVARAARFARLVRLGWLDAQQSVTVAEVRVPGFLGQIGNVA